jgi:hypothetical protein
LREWFYGFSKIRAFLLTAVIISWIKTWVNYQIKQEKNNCLAILTKGGKMAVFGMFLLPESAEKADKI